MRVDRDPSAPEVQDAFTGAIQHVAGILAEAAMKGPVGDAHQKVTNFGECRVSRLFPDPDHGISADKLGAAGFAGPRFSKTVLPSARHFVCRTDVKPFRNGAVGDA